MGIETPPETEAFLFRPGVRDMRNMCAVRALAGLLRGAQRGGKQLPRAYFFRLGRGPLP